MDARVKEILAKTERAKKAIADIREKALKDAHGFLLDSHGLPSGQTHREFPDGRIAVVKRKPENVGFDVVRWLDKQENEEYRKYYNLPLLDFQRPRRGKRV